ncbi:MAG: copper resistance CopC family protein [Candidatus Binatus sp.]
MKKLSMWLYAGAILAIVVSNPAVARAHSFPEQETPSAGQKVASPPPEVVIKFDAPIEKLFAKLEVAGADGQNLAVGTPQVSDDGILLSVKLGALKPGDYTVKWAVVCIDTHHTQGSYTFTVANGS